MRFIITLLICLFSFCVSAQINRSAREYAAETIGDYVQTKLFRAQLYKAIEFGEIKTFSDPNKDIYWTLEHRFEIGESRVEGGKYVKKPKTYIFCFYLDDKMQVKRADSYSNSKL